MQKKIVWTVVLLVFFLGMPLTVSADWEDFVDHEQLEADQDACEKEGWTCAGKCKSATSEESLKAAECRSKCYLKTAICATNAVNRNVKVDAMPKKAKKTAQKLTKQRQKGIEKCTETSSKCGRKCGWEDRECRDKCKNSWIDCVNRVQKKTLLNNKKLKEALKGITPEN